MKPYFAELKIPCKCGNTAHLQSSGGQWAEYHCQACGDSFETVRGQRFTFAATIECPRCTVEFAPNYGIGAESKCPNCGNVYRMAFELVAEGEE